MRYAAAIFDLDGTLLDTERLVMEAGLEALSELGHSVERAFMLTLIGVDAEESRRRLAAHVGAGFDLTAVNAAWAASIRRRYALGIPLKQGVDEILRITAPLPRAIATNSVTSSALEKLDLTGLAPHFQHVVGVDAVARPKPHPDLFLEAARRLGAAAAQCVVFEDSDAGVAAARAAGMTVVQVPDMHHSGTADPHHLAENLVAGARAAGLI